MWKKLKIVELASVLAGPLVGTFFSELGATVVKIENKLSGGDVTRTWKLASESKENSISAYYAAANFGKKTLFLDVTNNQDYARAIEKIKEADIVIQNFKPGDAKKLKLDPESLRKIKPNLIVACINGFGEDSSRPAFDVVLQAETGFMYMNGTTESGPVKLPVALIDILAAHHLKEAILIALIERLQTQEGKTIHVSLFDAAIASLANQASNFLMTGHIPQAMGTQHPNIAPYGDMYKSKDNKYFVLAIGSDKQFKQLCQVLEFDQISQEKFRANQDRLKLRKELNTLLENKIAQLTSTTIKMIFEEACIPFGQVKNMEEVFAHPLAQKMIRKESCEDVQTSGVRTLLS